MMKLQLTTRAASAAFAALLLALAAPARASLGSLRPLLDDDDDAESESKKEEDEEEEWFALVGGDVYTGTGAVLRDATILAKNGVIEEIGHGLFVPKDAKVLRVPGYRVYPGLVALGATQQISRGLFADADEPADPAGEDPHYGVDDLRPGDRLYGHVELGTGDDPDRRADDPDEPAADEAFEPQGIDEADEFDPFSQYLVLALATGITTAEQGNAALKLKRGEIEGVALSEKTRVRLSASKSNPGSIRGLREKFARASEYLRELYAWEEIKDKDEKKEREPSKKGVDTSVLEVLQKKKLAAFNANARADLIEIARLGQTYGFRPVIEGAAEGWTVADELGRAGAYVILTPRTNEPKDERLVHEGGTSIENAAILHRSGVQVAIKPQSSGFELSGITGRDLLHLPIEAGFAVRGGLPEDAALAGITIVPARLLGIAHRVGTIEVGKDCDLIVTDGDLLHYETFVQFAVVEGKEVYDKEEEVFFAHIRPRPDLPQDEAAEETVEPGPEAEKTEEVEEEEEEEEEEGDDESGDEESGEDSGGEDDEDTGGQDG